jgi:hypothetical protein
MFEFVGFTACYVTWGVRAMARVQKAQNQVFQYQIIISSLHLFAEWL